MRPLLLLMAIAIATLPGCGFKQTHLVFSGPKMHKAARFGYPDTGRIAHREGYIRSYDGRTRSSHWVLERLDADSLSKAVDRRDEFREPTDIDAEFRPALQDYRGATTLEGETVHRGHLPASRFHQASRIENSDTFSLDVMHPQAAGTNSQGGPWAMLEAAICELLELESTREVYVLSCPLYWPDDGADTVTYKVIGKNRIPVPTHSGKSVLAVQGGGRLALWSFLIPNRKVPRPFELGDFLVSTDQLEHIAGFNCWPKLSPDVAARLESRVAPMWKLTA